MSFVTESVREIGVTDVSIKVYKICNVTGLKSVNNVREL